MKKIKLTQNKFALVSDCDYDFLSQWKWCAANHGHTFYARRTSYAGGEKKSVFMHRLIGERAGLDMDQEVDHEDRNGLNNQRSNLRPANDKQQQENRGVQSNNTSGYRGVTWHKRSRKWQARVRHNRRDMHLGLFDTPEEASVVCEAKREELFTHG